MHSPQTRRATRMPLCFLVSFVLHAGLLAAGAFVIVDAAGGGGGGGQDGDEVTAFAIRVRVPGAEPGMTAQVESATPREELQPEIGAPPAPAVVEKPPPTVEEPVASLERAERPASPDGALSSEATGSSDAEAEASRTAVTEAASPGSGGGSGSGHGGGKGTQAGESADGPGPAVPSTPPVLVFGPKPDYPLLSVRHGEEGAVLCALRVGADGRVENVEIVRSSGHPRLDRSATDALRRWAFEPARQDGRALAARVLRQVVFRLE
jgi:protein TonB